MDRIRHSWISVIAFCSDWISLHFKALCLEPVWPLGSFIQSVLLSWIGFFGNISVLELHSVLIFDFVLTGFIHFAVKQLLPIYYKKESNNNNTLQIYSSHHTIIIIKIIIIIIGQLLAVLSTNEACEFLHTSEHSASTLILHSHTPSSMTSAHFNNQLGFLLSVKMSRENGAFVSFPANVIHFILFLIFDKIAEVLCHLCGHIFAVKNQTI